MLGRNPSQHHGEPCIAALSICGSTDFSPWFRSSSASLLPRRCDGIHCCDPRRCLPVGLKIVRAPHGNNVLCVLNRIEQDGVSAGSLTSVDPCNRRFCQRVVPDDLYLVCCNRRRANPNRLPNFSTVDSPTSLHVDVEALGGTCGPRPAHRLDWHTLCGVSQTGQAGSQTGAISRPHQFCGTSAHSIARRTSEIS